MPKQFNSPQRVKAMCFTWFARTFGYVEFPSVDIKTSNAADLVSG